jgi:hypothetical protein
MAVPAGHVLVRYQGVDHGLLGGLHDGLVERVQVLPRDEVEAPQVRSFRRRGVRAEGGGVRGGAGQEQVAGEVRAAGAGAGQAQGDAAGQRLGLVREQRGVGHDHGDHRSGARRCGPVVGHRVVGLQCLAERQAGQHKLLAAAEVRLQEDADRVLGAVVRHQARGRARAALELVAVHAGAAADRALLDGAGAGRLKGRDDRLLGDVVAVDVVQVAVPGLGGDGQQPGLGHRRVVLDCPGDDAGVGDADGVRVRDGDRACERAGFGDPGDAGHLAVAVLGVEACGYRVAGAGAAAGVDGGDAGADTGALDQRDVADLDAGHVGDRVPAAGAAGERDSQGAGAGLACRGRAVRVVVGHWSVFTGACSLARFTGGAMVIRVTRGLGGAG